MSDYAFDGFKPICQHKLIQALANSQPGTETARAYPPTLLEWTAGRDRVNMALDIFCFNGEGAGFLGERNGEQSWLKKTAVGA